MPGTWYPSRRPLRARLAALALLAGTALAGCGGSGSTVAKLPPLHPGLKGPASMFTPAGQPTAADLDELHRLGVDSVHLYMHWSDVAPNPTSRRRPSFAAADPAGYPASSWTNYDAIVRGTAARGMTLYVDLVPPVPRWASGPGAPHPASQTEWRPSASEFAQFVRAVGTRYSGHYVPAGDSRSLPPVRFWSIWNEPNLGSQLAPEVLPTTKVEVAAGLYRGLVNAAWKGLHATGHGQDAILIGEVAPAGVTLGNGPGLFQDMAPLRFLRVLYCVDSAYHPLTGAAASARGCPTSAAASMGFVAANPGLFHASGFADHPYPQGLPPNQPTPNEPDYAELADIGGLAHTLDTLQRVYGSHTRFPIYSTEYGYQTHPPDTEPGTVTQAAAAVYLNWSE
ncbi:MAG: hypothetical protein M3010_11120, partial [Candidatus Dormibacteraeota bacterium]|nr:hypothetical protein [Candidatus Dormibacteraeota bacterium]